MPRSAKAPLRPAHDQVDQLADDLDVLHVVALQRHAELVLDHLRELHEIERVDVELLERGVAAHRVLGWPERHDRLDDLLLNRLRGHCYWHPNCSFQADMPPSTVRVVPVT